MPDEIEQRLLKVVATTQHLPPEKVTMDSTFQELGVDSLDGINILFAVENEFDISIPDEAGENIRSMREMADGVRKLLAERGGEPSSIPANA